MEEKRAMRKRFRVLLLAAIVAAVVVPVGFALSLESTPAIAIQPRARVNVMAAPASTAVVAPVLIHADAATGSSRPEYGAAKLLFVGTALFGLAAAVRKAI